MPPRLFLAFACAHLTGDEAMAARVRGARLEFIEHCGHLSTIERPEIVSRVLANWLRQTDSSL